MGLLFFKFLSPWKEEETEEESGEEEHIQTDEGVISLSPAARRSMEEPGEEEGKE